MKSMTGYGRAQGEYEGRSFMVEARSVNHRYRDINLRLPRRYNPLEPRIRELVANSIERGRLELTINSPQGEVGFVVPELNLPLADRYRELFSQLRDRYGIHEELPLAQLFNMPDVIVFQEKELDLDQEWTVIERLISFALQELNDMRSREGNVLRADMEARIKDMTSRVHEIESLSAQVTAECHQRLIKKIAEMTKGVEIDQARIAQEAAFYAERSDITEEIVRLRSHLEQFAQVLRQHSAGGKKLEFILQEMHREINTIGSKASDSQIAMHVVEFKTDLERLREQAQNVE